MGLIMFLVHHWKLALCGLLAELLIGLASAGSRVVKPPSQRRPWLVVWVLWNALPIWYGWRAVCGWVLRRAYSAAARAVDRHERAQATATFPAGTAGN